MYDLVIRNARICDGTGSPAFPGAVGVRNDEIVAVGEHVGRGVQEVDAQGLTLAPGIIDIHTHYDAQITWDPFATPSAGLGVTTVIMGNCGFTIAPCRPRDRELMLRNLTQVEGMSLDALQAGTRWEFETFPEYLAMLERVGVVPNVAVYCGHSAVRNWVMGTDASRRAATDGEVAAMKQLVREALDGGAVGFATSTFEGHNGAGGAPMPSRLADERELRALVGGLGEAGRGVFMLTKGRQTTMPFLESLAADTGRPVMVAALVYDHADPQLVFSDLTAIGAARARGRRLYGQSPCTPITFDFTLTGAYLFEALDAWRPAIPLYGRPPELSRLYADTGFRQAVKRELVAPGAYNRFTDQWHTMTIVKAARPEHRHLELENVAALAAKDGKHPLDWLLDFGAADDFQTMFDVQILNSDEEQVRRLLKDPNVTIGLSDAGAHLSLFCDAGFGLHLLGRWVRERGDFTLEEAVRALTSAQAEIFGLRDRGLLAPGRKADLFLFDPATVGRGPKERARDLPTGAMRFTTRARGVHGVWVNGVRVVDDSGPMATTNRPGTVLREFSA
jgi:N-acyl-D-aspartate/D-glutamate deacylase